MANLLSLVRQVRDELADHPKQFQKTFYTDGVTTEFSLGIKPIDQMTLVLTVDGTEKAQGFDFELDARYGVIRFGTAPASGSTIQVYGFSYRYFSDDEIYRYVCTAVEQHLHERTDNFGSKMTATRLPKVEEYPVAILATIEALWALATDASFDIDISAPDGVTIPRSERFSQLSQIVQQRWEQYRQICSQLNVGLWRIEMGTLRRISRTTNKYVPLYMPQEVDDSRMPDRIFLSNDQMGYAPIPSKIGIYDLILTQGDSWSAVLDLNFDITGLTPKAEIRTFPNSPSLYAEIGIKVIKASQPAKVQLYLTKQQTEYLPTRGFWDLQLTSTTNDSFEQTVARGQVFVQQQVTLD